MNCKEASAFKWRGILSNLGIDDKMLTGQHGPCPICGGKDRFRFEPQSERGSYFCSQCGAGTGIHMLAQVKNVEYANAWKLVENVIGQCEPDLPKKEFDRAARINNVIKVCRPITVGGEVSAYLHSRGIDKIPPGLIEAPASQGGMMMVGRFAIGKKFAGLHVTFIRNGKKDDSKGSARKMFSFKKQGLDGSAVRLHPLGNGTKLIIAEGIETALSASMVFDAPAWATGSAGLMELVQIPEQVTHVIIAADLDTSFTGQKAAYTLAFRLHQQKKYVRVVLPNCTIQENVDIDWNDLVLRNRDAQTKTNSTRQAA